jgi:hypothetical protein
VSEGLWRNFQKVGENLKDYVSGEKKPGLWGGRAKILLNLLKCKPLIASVKSKRRKKSFFSPSNFFTFISRRKFCDIRSYIHFTLFKFISLYSIRYILWDTRYLH